MTLLTAKLLSTLYFFIPHFGPCYLHSAQAQGSGRKGERERGEMKMKTNIPSPKPEITLGCVTTESDPKDEVSSAKVMEDFIDFYDFYRKVIRTKCLFTGTASIVNRSQN